MNIKIKFLAFNTALIILVSSGLGFLSVLSVKRLLTQEAEKRVTDWARGFADVSSSGASLKDESSILPTIQEMMKRDDVLSIQVCDANGKIIAHSDIRKVG